MSGATPLDATQDGPETRRGRGRRADAAGDAGRFRQLRRARLGMGCRRLSARRSVAVAAQDHHLARAARFHRRPVLAGRCALAVEARNSLPIRSSICSPAARCSVPSSSSPIRFPVARRRGKLIFGFAAGVLAYTIRVFGGYPDGVAFAVLLMNLCVPLIDMYTQPPIFGMKNEQMTPPSGRPARPGWRCARRSSC
jgi:hypothetical protein